MINIKDVDDQLAQLDLSFRFWGRPEVLELAQILIPGERIQACLNGRYEGGFAMLCATDQRLLLVDKKWFHLTVEDVRYDMIAEVDFSSQFFSSSIRVCTPTKAVVFMSFKPKRLRALASFLQQRVMEIRQQYTFQAMPQPSAPSYIPAVMYQSPAGGADGSAAGPLPMPHFHNPYHHTPLLVRRRVGRLAPLNPPLD